MTSFGWSDLVSTALVGTSRRPAAPWSPALATLVPPDALAAPATEGGLLGAVGAITLARRAGVGADHGRGGAGDRPSRRPSARHGAARGPARPAARRRTIRRCCSCG